MQLHIRQKLNGLKAALKVLLYKGSYSLNYPLFSPDTLQISLTSRCNFRCLMCSVNKYLTKKEEEMTFEEICRIISTAKKQFDVKRLVITGGEPLLLDELIIKMSRFASNSQNLAVILTTNGSLIEQYASELATSGITHFHISLDGLEKTHNYIRQNKASFEKAINGIKTLIELRNAYKFNYSIGIASVILKPNIPDFYQLFLEADNLGIEYFDLLPYLPDNTEFSDTTGTSLWPDEQAVNDFLKVFEKITEVKPKNVRLNDFVDADLIAKYYLRKMDKHDWQCMAGYKNIFITMSDPKESGHFEPCIFMCKTHIPVRDYGYNLKKIWYSKKARLARKEITRCQTYCYQPCFSFPSIAKLLKIK